MQMARTRSKTAQLHAHGVAKAMFEGRTGHGGGECTYRQMRYSAIVDLVAKAFLSGARCYAPQKPTPIDQGRKKP